MSLTVNGVDRMAEVLMDRNLKYEAFDVRFFEEEDAIKVLAAVEHLGFRAEKHPFLNVVRIFRDTQARKDALDAGEVFEIELQKGKGGFKVN